MFTTKMESIQRLNWRELLGQKCVETRVEMRLVLMQN